MNTSRLYVQSIAAVVVALLVSAMACEMQKVTVGANSPLSLQRRFDRAHQPR